MIDLSKTQKGFSQAITLLKFRKNNPELFVNLHPQAQSQIEIIEENFNLDMFERFLKACQNISTCSDLTITETPKIYKRMVKRQTIHNYTRPTYYFLEKLYFNVSGLRNSDSETIKEMWRSMNIVSLIVNLYNVTVVNLYR